MELFLIFSILITLAAFFSYLNIKFLKLPSGISLMMMGVLAAAGVIVTGYFSSGFTEMIREKLALIDFSEFLLGILLSFLLFAGSLHVSIPELKKSAKSIISFATIGTLISTLIVGYSLFYLLSVFHQDIPLIYCLLFGALISPTDPIAVMGILKKTNLSKNIETNIVGESLFNDGIGVVIFVTILKIATVGPENFGPTEIGMLFIHEAIGGVIIGLIIGFIGYKLMKSIDHFQTEILISLAMVMGGYSLCHSIHVSGPLAMVVAGLMTGNRGKELAMSDITRDYLGKFWEVTDEVLNAILFMLIGLEIVIVSFDTSYLAIGIITALIILIARFVSLYVPAVVFRFKKVFGTKSLFIMTWGGLRGGISIALALSLPQNPYKDILVSITFVIVIFSILIQGITVEKVIKKLTS
ncbi:Sodium, potassium, lithium and rubidium/H(+) antiporter [Chryseobacterium nakagawai]|uniref:Sodium:proton antiporter n=1 Tax=Chryseobacterium nakagawai TaxID=1241982 RepID=A0AAD1DTH0_CHRNA|nr:sodium:proton antiporter [Chryseobacterium nakagawai]AZA92959.1 sodium:proton antiporter [Chryseobacterium nakagawai]VEH19584.1 Sodium, potassium, lithium and rubidium/H(+) antiporter [Chryseobacterium nakagawai]